MSRLWSRSARLLALAALAALPAAALGQNAAPPTDVPAAASAAAGSDIEAFFLTQGAAPPIEVLKLEGAPAGEYWIGVQLEPLPELIVSQLKLERGMVVVQVFDDSPAAKAEFRVNDIILRAGDKDVRGPQDLIAAVNGAKEQELAIVVLRGGSEATLKVTPVKRQAEQFELRVSPETPHATVVKALDELSTKTPHGAVRLLAVRPGGVFAYAAAAGAKLPSNLEVRIEKRGEEPAKIHVRRFQEGEDKTWEVTEDKVGDLPEDIRGHVQQMLGGQGEAAARVHLRLKEQMARAQDQAAQAHAKAQEAQQQMLREYRVKVQPQFRHPVPMPPVAVSPPIGGAPHPDHGIQVKLDAILKKLDQPQGEALERLQKEVEGLRKELDELRQDKK
jgi:hypothetical protein